MQSQQESRECRKKAFYLTADCSIAVLQPEMEPSLPLTQQGIQKELVNSLIFSICSPGDISP